MSSPFTSIFQTPKEFVDLLQKYLDDRTLEPSDFPDGLMPQMSPSLLQQMGFNTTLQAGRPFIFIQYLNPKGEMYMDDQGRPYQVARFLGKHSDSWSGEAPPKVLSPNGRPNVLHFEPIRPIDGEYRDWYNLPDGQIVVHVESAIKAKAVHKWTGFPTVGLNGVSSYSASKRGIELLHATYDVDFTRFTNVILFDSNTWKDEVARARDIMAFRMKQVLGCKDVRLASLPQLDGQDIGPDDYLRALGNQGLIEIIRSAEPYAGQEFDDLIQTMQSRAVYCTRGGTIVDRGDKVVRSDSKAILYYAPVNKKVLRGKSVVNVSGYSVWKEFPERNEVVNPAYEYLGGEFISREDGVYYNLYQKSGPWPDVSQESDGGLIVEQLRNMMSESDLALLRSYMKFLKYTPEKPTSFPVLYSDKRGVGKGWFSKLAHRFIGFHNTSTTDAKAFASNFNAALANKRLIVINEFKTSASEKAAAMNSMKRFFGDEFISIEPKGIDAYAVENRAGMIVTCNSLEDVPTDGLGDRRMWYIECDPKREVDEAGWGILHKAVDDLDQIELFCRWVAWGEDVNFSSWRPPMDEGRERAILAASSSLEAACRGLLLDLREGEDVICLSYASVVALLRPEYPRIVETAAKSVTTTMKHMGWKASEKKYGRNGEQKVVWIIDEKRFGEIQHTGSAVTAECDRVAKLASGASKY